MWVSSHLEHNSRQRCFESVGGDFSSAPTDTAEESWSTWADSHEPSLSWQSPPVLAAGLSRPASGPRYWKLQPGALEGQSLPPSWARGEALPPSAQGCLESHPILILYSQELFSAIKSNVPHKCSSRLCPCSQQLPRAQGHPFGSIWKCGLVISCYLHINLCPPQGLLTSISPNGSSCNPRGTRDQSF